MITGSPCIATILAGGVKSFSMGKSRRALFEKYPPVRVWVSSSRIRCVPNGDFSSKESSAVCYAWFVWKKGHRGEITIRWFN